MTDALPVGRSVAIVGCGLIGRKRAEALNADDRIIGCFDVDDGRAEMLARDFGCVASRSLDDLLSRRAEIVIVATIHCELAAIACAALAAGSHVLLEKPGGIGTAEIDQVAEASARNDRLVKVGFNHRFHPGIARAISEARSGEHGEVLYFRARYGHGGRPGYEHEWRADPALSGGGEIVDQGMHLLDLSYWLHGDLPLYSSLLRTQFWNAPVDDNAVIILGEQGGVGCAKPFSLIHVSWTEWKNTFSLEIACRGAKIAVDGLVRSYGPQHLRIYTMKPELGPPDLEEVVYDDDDVSWRAEWHHFCAAIDADDPKLLLGDLASARYAWACIEATRT